MAFDAFLKLDGIKGESNDSKHKDEIEIESFSWGATQSGSFASGGGGGAGKVQFQDFHFNSLTNKASPVLFLKCASGSHLKEAILTVRKAGANQQDFIKITMTDVLVSSYQSGGVSAGDAPPTDQFALNFAKIDYALTTQNADGKPGDTINGGWDLKQNKAV
jgi:type VI secretion system secreted protein Hcp